MKKGTLLYLAQAGMIAAIYAALTYLPWPLILPMEASNSVSQKR